MGSQAGQVLAFGALGTFYKRASAVTFEMLRLAHFAAHMHQ
jgi:hypothetical protein